MGAIVFLVIITIVLCIVMLCIKRYHKKKASSVDDRVSYSATKLNKDPTEDTPSYDVIRADNGTIKQGDLDGINLYYNIPIKPCSKTSEDECNYAQPSQHSHLIETIKMDSNPSYGVSTGDLGKDVKMDTNPSYGVSMKESRVTAAENSDTKAQQSSYNATTKQYDYAYTHVNRTKP